jgi:hypothetical protein
MSSLSVTNTVCSRSSDKTPDLSHQAVEIKQKNQRVQCSDKTLEIIIDGDKDCLVTRHTGKQRNVEVIQR